jgi:hypothetical protein
MTSASGHTDAVHLAQSMYDVGTGLFIGRYDVADTPHHIAGRLTVAAQLLQIQTRMALTFKSISATLPPPINKLCEALSELQQLKAEALTVKPEVERISAEGDPRMLGSLNTMLVDMDANGQAYLNMYNAQVQADKDAQQYKDNIDRYGVAIRGGVIADQAQTFNWTHTLWSDVTFNRCPACHSLLPSHFSFCPLCRAQIWR